MKKINILVAGTFHFPMLAQHLISLGYDVKIYTSTPKYRFKSTDYYSHIFYIPMFFQIYRKITKGFISSWMKEFDSFFFDTIASLVMRDCDILYGFAGYSMISGKKIKKRNKIYILDRACPHILFQRNMLLNESDKFDINFNHISDNLIDKHLKEYNLADYIVVPSKYTSDTFYEKKYLKKIKIISLDAKLTNIPSKHFVKRDREKFVVGIVGGGLLRKGYYYLVKAWDELNLKNSTLLIKNVKLELLQIPEIANILKFNNSIKFHGYVKEINDFYKKCDVFCIPSIDDGFGMVVPEALANSLPVITTTNVGASSLIKNDYNGYVIKPRSIKELKDKILFLNENPKKLSEMQKNAFKSFNDYKNTKSYKIQLEEFFNKITKKMSFENKIDS